MWLVFIWGGGCAHNKLPDQYKHLHDRYKEAHHIYSGAKPPSQNRYNLLPSEVTYLNIYSQYFAICVRKGCSTLDYEKVDNIDIWKYHNMSIYDFSTLALLPGEHTIDFLVKRISPVAGSSVTVPQAGISRSVRRTHTWYQYFEREEIITKKIELEKGQSCTARLNPSEEDVEINCSDLPLEDGTAH